MLYPIGIQSFEKIIKGGFAYVDKTDLVYDLIHSGQYYFLSRPRRFGKSLLVSTIETYFKGEKDIFKGLKIFDLEKNWVQYPILHIDFSGRSYLNTHDLYLALDCHLSQWECAYDINHSDKDLSSRFINIIDCAFRQTGKPVVILVDEYEKPIIDNISNIPLMEEFRNILQGFYSIIKIKDPQIRFAFFTGVTKLGKLSVFSGLNNLQDISLDAKYNALCGITCKELQLNFREEIKILADDNNLSLEACYDKLQKMYDGYHFHHTSEGVYNPFSLFNALSKKTFGEYWFETGTPSFLVKYLKAGNFILDDITKDDIPLNLLTGTNYESLQPITLMFQTGYLTIKGYNPRFNTYNLDYPNEEVKSGFLNSLSQCYAPQLISGDFSVYKFITDIENGDAESFMRRFSAFWADNNYQIQGNLELYFQNVMSIMLKMIGLYVRTEYQTSGGRIDITFQTSRFIYIIEVKVNKTASDALSQIERKGYADAFSASGKSIIKIGVNFSSSTKGIDDWEIA